MKTSRFLWKEKAWVRKSRTNQWITDISELPSAQNLNHEVHILTLEKFQQELDDVPAERAEGAFIHSGKNGWRKERNTKCVFSLERRNAEVNSRTKLKINDTICKDNKLITKYITDFYAKLYQPSTKTNILETIKEAKTAEMMTENVQKWTLEEILTTSKS